MRQRRAHVGWGPAGVHGALTSGRTHRPPGCLSAWRPSARPGLWGGTLEVAKGPGWDELQKKNTEGQELSRVDMSSPPNTLKSQPPVPGNG